MFYLIPTFLCVAAYALYRRLLPKPLPGIAFNPEAAKTLLGDVPSMSRDIALTGEFSMWLAKQVERMRSPVCQVFVRPFALPWILVADYREAEDILMRRNEFDKPQFLIDAMQGLGDFHARYKTGEAFRARRQLRQDLMTPSFLNNTMAPFMHSEGIKLVRFLEQKTALANGRPFSILDDYLHAALDIMLFYAFGENLDISALDPCADFVDKLNPKDIPTGALDEPVTFPELPMSGFLMAVQNAPHVLERTANSWMPKLSFWWWRHQAWFKEIYVAKDNVLPQQLKKAFDNYREGKIHSALDHMMMREEVIASKQDREARFVSKSMADEIFSDVLSGHHTTGGAMAWNTKYLTGYQDVQKKLREALYEAIPEAVAEKRSPTVDELRRVRIPYLEAVIEETRRLTPFTIARETTQDTTILGRHVPRGCQVFMVNSGPGFLSPSIPVEEHLRSETSKGAKLRDKWDESKDLRTFEPERWLVTREDGSVEFDGAAGPQLGFGMGIRQCWGRRMAHAAIRTVIALVIWNFELMDIPDELGGYAALDGISRQPQKAIVRLRRIPL
jgi:hypothetical protein